MHPTTQFQLNLTRRQFFGQQGLRLGSLALAAMAGQSLSANDRGNQLAKPQPVHPPLPGLPHFAPRAKSIIYVHYNGGPPQHDTWDYKPGLNEYFDKDLPDSVRNGQRLSTMTSGQTRFPVAPSKFKFQRVGEAGVWANTELMPYTSKLVDDFTLIRSVHTNAINHDPACTFVMTGSEVPGKASIGSWLAYGLGSENNDLPAFVVFTPRFPADSNAQALYNRMWGSGFLPTRFNGVALRGSGDPVLYLPNPEGVMPEDRRAMLDALNELNQQNLERFRRSRDGHAHRAVRDGVPHAEQCARTDRYTTRICVDLGPLRSRCNRARHVCSQRPVGQATGRTRRADGANLASRLGHARRPAPPAIQSVQRHRPRYRSPGIGS